MEKTHSERASHRIKLLRTWVAILEANVYHCFSYRWDRPRNSSALLCIDRRLCAYIAITTSAGYRDFIYFTFFWSKERCLSFHRLITISTNLISWLDFKPPLLLRNKSLKIWYLDLTCKCRNPVAWFRNWGYCLKFQDRMESFTHESVVIGDEVWGASMTIGRKFDHG